jgi:hypothetical protein
VYVGSDDGFLYALRPDASLSPAARLIFKLDLNGRVRSSPAIGADGTLYVGGDYERMFAIASTGTVPPEPGCSLFTEDGKNYWFCETSRSWQTAQNNCELAGMNLAQIIDSTENGFIREHVADDAWIGGNDIGTEGTWIWRATGQQFWQGNAAGTAFMDRYSNWSFGEPGTDSSRDCVRMSDLTGRWSDQVCSGSNPYVCEETALSGARVWWPAPESRPEAASDDEVGPSSSGSAGELDRDESDGSVRSASGGCSVRVPRDGSCGWLTLLPTLLYVALGLRRRRR